MKKLLSFAFLWLLAQSTFAQLPVSVRTTNGTAYSLGVSNSLVVAGPITFNGNLLSQINMLQSDGSGMLGGMSWDTSGDLIANSFLVNSGPTVIDVNGNFVGPGTNNLQKITTNLIATASNNIIALDTAYALSATNNLNTALTTKITAGTNGAAITATNAITGGVGVGSAIIPVLNMTRQTGLFNSTAASNSVPALGGQMGYWYDVNTNQWSLFMSRTNGTNWDAWNPVLGIPEGIFAIGSQTNMNRFITGSVQVFVNGATNNQTIARRDADGVYVFNDPNPYSSGSGVSAAMWQTNSTGVGSTLANQFAIEMVATPNGGSTNNLPGYVQIVCSGFPFSLDATTTIGGVSGNYSTILRDINNVERHSQWIGGKFIPSQSGYADGYSYDPVNNLYTNNATQQHTGAETHTGQVIFNNVNNVFGNSANVGAGAFGTLRINSAGTPGSPNTLFLPGTANAYVNVNSAGDIALGKFVDGSINDYFIVGTNTHERVWINTNATVVGNLTVTGTYTGNGTNLTNLPPAAIQYRAGFSNLANLSVSQAVTFVVPFPASVGTNYTPSVSFLGAALAGSVSPSYNSITTNGFTVNLSVGITGGENFGWTATPWTTPSR